MDFFMIFLIFNTISGKIQGIVKDETTKQPLPYADILILNTDLGAAADEEGNFYILNVPPGRYIVEISCLGYQTKRLENIIVEINQTARLQVNLKQTTIELPPVTVTGEMPAVKKDMVGATYIVRKEEISYLPVDYATGFITFQPSVAHLDTAIHVRGGRATEVNYLIDNVSVIDPFTGEPAINLSKGIVDEVIFLPGGFDAEYGRAMSGVVNIITEHPKDKLSAKVYGKTETIMPFYYDFGYQDYQATIHLPVTKRFKGLASLDLMHTGDWDPKLYILPHKQRDDYALYTKWQFNPSGKLKLNFSGAKSRTQFDRYWVKWKFNLAHYLSDMKKGDLEAFNLSYLPDSRRLFNVTLSRLFTRVIQGVREDGDFGPFDDFVFRDYRTLKWYAYGNKNPFGVWLGYFPIDEGDWPEYRNRTSLVMKCNLTTNLQIHKYHELKAGLEYTYQDFNNFDYWVSGDTLNPVIDEWRYSPLEYSVFVQDNIDYEGLYAKLGCRYDYFSSHIYGIKPKIILSPRLGFSFLVTEKILFRANVGKYTQPPLYDYMYSYYNLLPYPTYIWYHLKDFPIGNPELGPEKTTSYEIGFQGEIRKNLGATFNAFYKDISDLIGTRLILVQAFKYTSYFNVEYGNVKGIEAILDIGNAIFTGKLSYTLSWARGTSSYAREVHDILQLDTTFVPPTEGYYLDFDQRHRIFVQGVVNLPMHAKLNILGYLGNGFPYTPPGAEGKTEERNELRFSSLRQLDCIIVKPFRIKSISFNVNLEVINVLDERYQISPYAPFIKIGAPWDYRDYAYSLIDEYYHPAADFNHDGLITPYEYYTALRALAESTNNDVWINCYTAPRRTRLGIGVNF